jgi:hypothetical protein
MIEEMIVMVKYFFFDEESLMKVYYLHQNAMSTLSTRLLRILRVTRFLDFHFFYYFS